MAFAFQADAATIDLSQPVDQSFSPDLVYWKFDESSGSSVANSASSGSGFDGTVTSGAFSGAPTPSFSGAGSVFGNSLYLPGEGKSGTTTAGPFASWTGEPGQTDLDLVATDFTGGIWIKLETVNSAAQTIQIFQRGTSQYMGSFWISASRTRNGGVGSPYQWQLQMGVGAVSGTGHEAYLTDYLDLDAFSVGEWYHVGFSFDYRGDEEGDLKNIGMLYLNGVKVGEFEFDASISMSTGQRKFRIGERAASSFNGKFDGHIDDFFLTSGVHAFAPIPEPGTVGLLMGATALGGALSGFRKISRKQD